MRAGPRPTAPPSAASEAARRAEGEVARLQNACRARRPCRSRPRACLPRGATPRSCARDAARSLAHQLATARAERDTVGPAAGRARPADGVACRRHRARGGADADARRGGRRARGRAHARSTRGWPMPKRSPRGSPADLTAAEARSREAEAALAGLLASEAAMRAERRVADAAIEAARDQAARVEAEQRRLAEQLAALGDGAERARRHRRGRARLASKRRSALATAEAQLVAAEEARAPRPPKPATKAKAGSARRARH